MPTPFDLLTEYGTFGAERKISLRDPGAIPSFTELVRDALSAALNNPIWVHGKRVEAMFESLLLSLDAYRLVKTEDCGTLFPTDRFRAPDFRVVLEDGAQWLIEVKNVYEKAPFQQRRRLMDRAYLAQLESYTAATGASLKVAVFWARWMIWTLISPERLVDENGDLVLDMPTAMKVNELGLLGDRHVGTTSPLRLRLSVDPAGPIAADGTVQFTITDVQIFSGDDKLTDPIEQEIAGLFMEFGAWEEAVRAVVDGDILRAVEFRWEPIERSDQGFEFIGALSSMFARYYALQTVKDREVVQLRAPLRPGWFAHLVHRDHHRHPLWIFNVQPNFVGIEGTQRREVS